MTTTYAHIPLADIIASRTNPRKHFDPAKLGELAASIKVSGVHTPVRLRPLPGSRVEETAYLDPRPAYELVSGERRYRASVLAGTGTIPAVVSAMTDEEALEIQLTENLQRDDLTAMEEAEGYDTLREHAFNQGQPTLTVDQIAERIGKSRSHVYARLKLLALCPEGREALRQGLIQTAVAEQIARIPDTQVQAQALANVFNPMTGEAMSVREARGLIQRQYMLRLAEAPFDRDDPVLSPAAGSCATCSKRTGADPDLFADMAGADLCLDLGCYKVKEHEHQRAQLAAARATGATIIEGREAREIIPPTSDGRIDGYLRLDDPRDAPGKGSKTLRHAIGDLMQAEGIKPTLVVKPGSKDAETIAVIDTATATRLLAQKGHQEQAEALQAKARTSAKAAAELQKQQDRDRFEHAWRWAIMEQTWRRIGELNAREPGAYNIGAETIRCLARDHIPTQPQKAEPLAVFLGLGKVGPVPALVDWVNDHRWPEEALALLILYEATHNWQGSPTGGNFVKALTVATDDFLGIDPETIKAEVQADHEAQIKARKASAPLPSAAPADGARGGDKPKGKTGGKARKPAAAPAEPRLTPEDALQGIAAAMQGEEGRATSPDAGASETELEKAWPYPAEPWSTT